MNAHKIVDGFRVIESLPDGIILYWMTEQSDAVDILTVSLNWHSVKELKKAIHHPPSLWINKDHSLRVSGEMGKLTLSFKQVIGSNTWYDLVLAEADIARLLAVLDEVTP
jgi:hypothetical protein